jgi:hypothetical protein
MVLPTTAAAVTSCTGTSTKLSPGQCNGWLLFWAATGGRTWKVPCNDKKDPCACHHLGKKEDYAGIRCNSDNTTIVKMVLSNNNLTGSLPALKLEEPLYSVWLKSVTTYHIDGNHLTGPISRYSDDHYDLFVPVQAYGDCRLIAADRSNQFTCNFTEGLMRGRCQQQWPNGTWGGHHIQADSCGPLPTPAPVPTPPPTPIPTPQPPPSPPVPTPPRPPSPPTPSPTQPSPAPAAGMPSSTIIAAGCGAALLVLGQLLLLWRRRAAPSAREKNVGTASQRLLLQQQDGQDERGDLEEPVPAIKVEVARARRGGGDGAPAAAGGLVAHPLLLPCAPGAVLFSSETLESATGGFSPTQLLGEGVFGAVYRGVLGGGGGTVAIKVLKPEMLGRASKKKKGVGAKSEFENEAQALATCRHPNVVVLLGHCYDEAGAERRQQAREPRRRVFRRAAARPPPPLRHCLVFEFLPGGTLQERLTASPSGGTWQPLLWQQRLGVASDLARALHFLHRRVEPPIIHQDVKSTNVLLDGGGGGGKPLVAKLTDFGMARFSPELINREHQTTEQIVGTPIYMPMELLLSGHVSEKTDTYALSIVVLELLTGKLPSNDVRIEDMLVEPEELLPAVLDRRAVWPPESAHAVRLARVAARCHTILARDRSTVTDVLPELDELAGRVFEK